MEKSSRMSPKRRSIIAIAVSLLFAVNTVYAMDMKVDFQMGKKGQAEQPVEMKKSCHGESHGSSAASMDDYSYDCCGVDCHSCVSVTVFQSVKLVSPYVVPDHFESMDILSAPQDAFASNLYRPPIIS